MSSVMREIGLKMREQRPSIKDAILKKVSDTDLVNGVDRLIYNHCKNKTELAKEVFKCSRNTLQVKLDEAQSNGFEAEYIEQNQKHLYTRHSIQKLMDMFNLPSYRDSYQSNVILFENHKGGTGKTSSAISLAVASALDIDLNAKCLFIDLDPQGTAGPNLIYSPDEDSIYLTMVDMLLSEYEDEGDLADQLAGGISFDEVLNLMPFKSHLPNLDVIPAFPTDDRFTDTFWSLDDTEQHKLLTKLATKIIPQLKEKYDLIFIDLPPQDSPLVWSANEAADVLIAPITPRIFDYVSTSNYLITTAERLSQLPSKGENIKLFKMLITNYNDKSAHQRETVNSLIKSANIHMFSSSIAHSEAFVAASSSNRTVLDVMKSEKICSDSQYELAKTSIMATYNQFITEIKMKSI